MAIVGQQVRITDVSPRDGLQNEPGVIPTSDKSRLVRLLLATGVDEVEVSSFVSPRWVPQLGDAAEVFAEVAEAVGDGGPLLSALVPNEKGMEALLEVNRRAGRRLIGRVSLFTAASETFSKRNTNASIVETFARFRPVVGAAAQHGLGVRVYVSCAIACPFEGEVPPGKVAEVADRAVGLLDHSSLLKNMDQPGLGDCEVVLADTIGAATPGKVALLLGKVDGIAHPVVLSRPNGPPTLGLHLHDTFGKAAECVSEALRLGVRSFDGAVGGLGGCPYASTPGRRAPGNIDTGLLVRTIEEAGYKTGVSDARLREAAEFATELKARGGAA